jgi:hypothetical protein
MIPPWWLHLCLGLLTATSELVHQCCTETEYYGHYRIYNTKNAPWVTMTRDETWKFSFFWHNSPHWARAPSFTRFLYHTRHTTVSRTPLDEWSAHRRDLYLSNIQHPQQTNIHAPGEIQTHNLSTRVATNLCLRRCGYWDRHTWKFTKPNFKCVSSLCSLVQLIMYYCYEIQHFEKVEYISCRITITTKCTSNNTASPSVNSYGNSCSTGGITSHFSMCGKMCGSCNTTASTYLRNICYRNVFWSYRIQDLKVGVFTTAFHNQIYLITTTQQNSL